MHMDLRVVAPWPSKSCQTLFVHLSVETVHTRHTRTGIFRPYRWSKRPVCKARPIAPYGGTMWPPSPYNNKRCFPVLHTCESLARILHTSVYRPVVDLFTSSSSGRLLQPHISNVGNTPIFLNSHFPNKQSKVWDPLESPKNEGVPTSNRESRFVGMCLWVWARCWVRALASLA